MLLYFWKYLEKRSLAIGSKRKQSIINFKSIVSSEYPFLKKPVFVNYFCINGFSLSLVFLTDFASQFIIYENSFLISVAGTSDGNKQADIFPMPEAGKCRFNKYYFVSSNIQC